MASRCYAVARAARIWGEVEAVVQGSQRLDPRAAAGVAGSGTAGCWWCPVAACWSRVAPAADGCGVQDPIWSLQARRRGGLRVALHSSGLRVVWGVPGPMEVRVDLGLLRGSGCPW